MSTLFPKILGQLDGFPKNLEKSRGSQREIFRGASIRTDILAKYFTEISPAPD